MNRETARTKYKVGGRNGYYAIDEERAESCKRNIDCFKTHKQAKLTAGHLGSAYSEGWRDAVGQWPSDEHSNPADLPACYLGCPTHSPTVSDCDPTPAAKSAEENRCEACATVAEFIRTRDTLRRLTVKLHQLEQAHEDEKHGTGNSYKSGMTRPPRV